MPAGGIISGAMRYAEHYSSEMGCVRAPPRLTHARARASRFAGEFLSPRAELVWLLYLAIAAKVALALRVEPYSLMEKLVEFPDASPAACEYDGYVYHYAPRAQALRQLLVQMLLAPAISRVNRAMMTPVVVEGLAVCPKMMCRGARPESPRGASSSDPWSVIVQRCLGQCRRLSRLCGRSELRRVVCAPPARVADGRDRVAGWGAASVFPVRRSFVV